MLSCWQNCMYCSILNRWAYFRGKGPNQWPHLRKRCFKDASVFEHPMFLSCSDKYLSTVLGCDHTHSHSLQEALFFLRVLYDLSFFFLVIIIIIQNLIFGVIIDTFADLRSEKNKKEYQLKNTCFICGEYRRWRGRGVEREGRKGEG